MPTSHTPSVRHILAQRLPIQGPTTVKDRIIAINATQYNTKKPASPHQKLARSKSLNELGMSTGQTTKLQVVFNKLKQIDPFHYEERVQKQILKQQTK